MVSALFGDFQLSQHAPPEGAQAKAKTHSRHLELGYPAAARGAKAALDLRALWHVIGEGAAAKLNVRIGDAVHPVPLPAGPEEALEFRVEFALAEDGDRLRIVVDAAIPPIELPGSEVLLSVEAMDLELLAGPLPAA